MQIRLGILSFLIIAGLLRAQQPYETIRRLRGMERTDPADAALPLQLALAYYAAGQKILFQRYAEEAARRNPRDPQPHYALGRHALDDLQQQDAAARHFQEALRLDPAHVPSLYHLGWCHELDGQSAKAEALYRKANNWLAHLGLARLALEANETGKALEHARLGAQANEPSAYTTLARVLLRAGQTAQAIEALQKAALLDPADARIPYQISRAAAARKDAALEAESLRKYNELRALYTQR
ncbi:MAG: tetratricopeptide repeat protein [Acidobacteria bacterium]|nr:tetratricopeptide repeat protein [Acidobacteriota bacterium]